MHKSVSLFFPAYNEEKNIGRAIQKAVPVLSSITDDWELIIVNDGSQDKTADIADSLAKGDSRIRVVHHEKNRGYGAALRTGFLNATKELICFAPADNQFDLDQLTVMVDKISDADIVVGYRENRQDPGHRLLNALIFNTSANILFGMKIKDIDCGFKIFRREILHGLKLESDGALIDTEILIKTRSRNARIKQVALKHFPRQAGHATGSDLRVILKAVGEIGRLWLKYIFKRLD